MARVILGNHSAVRVPRSERDRVRAFYLDVLDCKFMREGEHKDDLRLADNFFFAILYENDGAALNESEFRKAIYLELKTDSVEVMREKILAFGVTVLHLPDPKEPHLYFQAPGGQVFRLVGIDEDLSRYEGTEHGEQFVGTQFTTTPPNSEQTSDECP